MRTVPRIVRSVVAAGVALVVAACAGEADDIVTTTTAPVRAAGAETPDEAVASLTRALAVGRFVEAVDLTVDGQMLVVALAEGLDVDGALSLLEMGADDVGVNFWGGFAASLEDFLGYEPDDIEIGTVSTFEVDDRRFARVDAFVPLDSAVRHFVVQEEDGWRIDVLATFASALAGKLPDAADLVRGHPEGAPLLEVMRRHIPSLRAVIEGGDAQPQLVQAALAAIERIQR